MFKNILNNEMLQSLQCVLELRFFHLENVWDQWIKALKK